jgi:hypothetical protein
MHDTRPLTLDKELAKAVQKAMDKDDIFDASTVAMPSTHTSKCSQNMFFQEDENKVLELVTSTAATDAWYSGRS